MRRVLDPMFVYFDLGRHWIPQQGLAMMVLSDISYLMESSGILISLRLLPHCVLFMLCRCLKFMSVAFCRFLISLALPLPKSRDCRVPKVLLSSAVPIPIRFSPSCADILLIFTFIPGNQQLILASLIRHLDHKNVAHDPQLKSYVIQVATALARQIRSGVVLAEIGFVCDLCRHLRKSLQATVESVGEQESNSNILLQNSIEDCLLETAKGVSLILVI